MKVEIFMLGGFMIVVDGVDIVPALGNSKKKLSLLQYLILKKDETVSNATLFESIWPGEESTNPESSLKTLVSRLRQNLKEFGMENAIATKQWAYRWNEDLDAEIDAYTFEELCNQAADFEALTDENKAVYDQILDLYKGDLLMGYDTETWIVPKSVHYHDLYLRILYSYIGFLQEEKRHQEVIQLARKGLEVDRFDPKINLALMTALLETGAKNEAMSHYNYTVNLHYTQLGVTPSDDILSFYKSLEQVEQDTSANMDEICKSLLDEDDSNTAYVCDYSIFKDVYQLNMRNLERLNITMFLGLITVTSADNSKPTDMLLLDKVIENLINCLKINLRRGDTISRYTPTQVAVLLPVASQKAGSIAMERVKKAFYSQHSTPDFVVSYKLRPIGTKE